MNSGAQHRGTYIGVIYIYIKLFSPSVCICSPFIHPDSVWLRAGQHRPLLAAAHSAPLRQSVKDQDRSGFDAVSRFSPGSLLSLAHIPVRVRRKTRAHQTNSHHISVRSSVLPGGKGGGGFWRLSVPASLLLTRSSATRKIEHSDHPNLLFSRSFSSMTILDPESGPQLLIG